MLIVLPEEEGVVHAPVGFLLAFLSANLPNAFSHHLLCCSSSMRGDKWDWLDYVMNCSSATECSGKLWWRPSLSVMTH